MSEVGAYFRYPRTDVVALVPETCTRVLDVGCAAGVVGAALKRRQRCTVVGIERDPTAARAARAVLDEVLEIDLEWPGTNWCAQLGRQPFDCLIYADVLEHLREPRELLVAQRALLAPGGIAIVSVPNVRHYPVVLGLLRGEWRYQDEGVLDRTHLRFFTRRSLIEMLASAGYRVDELRGEVHASRTARWLGALSLGAARDFLARQFLARCTPESERQRS